jgi:Ca2+-binding RTX toxin-like protein
MRQTMTKGAALGWLLLLLAVLLGAATPALAAEHPENGSLIRQEVTQQQDAALDDVEGADPTATANTGDDSAATAAALEATKRGKHHKKRHPRPPTCFGKRATIIAHGAAFVETTPGNDVIIGDDRANTIVSGISGGTDRICGGGGDDEISLSGDANPADLAFISGGPGADRIVGLAVGRSVLVGGDGNDELRGGTGDDDLFGGDGGDRLFGEFGVDLLDGGPGVDACQQDFNGQVVSC